MPDDMNIAVVSAPEEAGDSLQDLVAAIPPDSRVAWVVVPPWSLPFDHDLAARLRDVAGVPLKRVVHGTAVLPGMVHLVPPGQVPLLEGRLLRLTEWTDQAGDRSAMDQCLASVVDTDPQAFAVLLPGSGAQSAPGLRDLRAAGGAVLRVARTAGVSDRGQLSPLVDRVVMAAQVPAVIDETRRVRAVQVAGEVADPTPAQLEDVERLTGFRTLPVADRAAFLADRLFRRMAITGTRSTAVYVDRLQSDALERSRLTRDVMYAADRFFPEPGVIEGLRDTALIPLLQRDQPEFRVWVAGCGTGEVVYSLAMAITELAGAQWDNRPWKLFGTDTDTLALQQGRSGLYGPAAVAGVDPARQDAFLRRIDGGRYLIDMALRDMCIFAEHDLHADAPFDRLDLILCRRPEMLDDPALAGSALAAFQYGLREGGFLALLPGRAGHLDGALFETVDARLALFSRRRHKRVESALRAAPGRLPGGGPTLRAPSLGRRSEAAAAEHAILQVMGTPFASVDDTGRFLHVSTPMRAALVPVRPGVAHGLQDMRAPELARAAMSALAEVRDGDTDGAAAEREVAVEVDGGWRSIRLCVAPMEGKGRRYLVFLDDVPPGRGRDESARPAPGAAETERWRQEIHSLQTRTRSVERALSSANRELQALNEELQSSNKELRISREELEVINGKLHDFNIELQATAARLEQQNAELEAIYDGVPIGLGMIGRDMTWSRGNRFLARLFDLPPGEVEGAPVATQVPELMEEVAARVETVLQGAPPQPEVEIRLGEDDGGAGPRILMADVFPVTLDGEVTAAGLAVRDVTAERAISDEKDLLTAEMAHRVKNMLAVMRAVTRFSAQRADDKEELATRLTHRLSSMGRTFELLSEGNWRSQDLRQLVETSLAVFVGMDDQRFSHVGPGVALSAEETQALGLALHELGTNALKYGAFSVPEGRVELRVEAEEGRFSRIIWTEMGGPRVVPPTNLGFGTFLLEAILGRQLHADVRSDYRPEGLRFTIERDTA